MHTWSRGGGILNNAYGTLNKISVDETTNIFGGKIVHTLGEFCGKKWASKQKNVLSKSILKEPITFYRMTSSIIVEVALVELKMLICQIVNGE